MSIWRFCSVFALILTGATTFAADEKPAPSGVPEVKKEETVREQKVYVPYSKLQKVFEQHGQGVYLPYDEFQKLWAQARASLAKGPDYKPPVGALITQIDSEASAGDQVLQVNSKLKIELLAEGWHEVPLRLADAAILSAKIGDQPARLVAKPSVGYVLLAEKKGKNPEQIELVLQYSKAITKTPGQNSVSVQAPQAPVNQWQIRIPQAGVKVNVHPLIAATEAPKPAPPKPAPPTPAPPKPDAAKPDPSKPDTAKPDAAKPVAKPDAPKLDTAKPAAAKPREETVVMAFVGAAPTVQIDWTPKAEGATGLEALATVQAEQQVTIDEGVLRTRVQLAYKISRAELPKLVIEAPADHKVLNVFDPNVKEWKVDTKEQVHTITVQLYQPARETQAVTVELEKFSEALAKGDVSMPVVKAVGVGRQQGVLVVRVAPTLRAEPAAGRSGLSQLDAAELPPALAGSQWNFSYRYAAVPFALALTVEKLQPQIRTRELVEAYLEPERLTLDLFALYEIERAGVFQLELEIPQGFEVRTVRGHAAAGAQAVSVDAHHVTDAANRRALQVNLSRKALGKVGLFVELQKKLDDQNLREPTEKASEITWQMPRVAAQGVEQMTGRLLVYAPESLTIDPKKKDGVQVITFAEAVEGTASTRQNRFSGTREVLAYAYGREAVDLQLAVERRKPSITVRQFLLARVDAGVVKYEATFFYDILYSRVKELRLDVPADLAGSIQKQTDAINKAPLDPQPAGLDPAQYVAWKLWGEGELFGSFAVKFAWEKKRAVKEGGVSQLQEEELPLPRLVPHVPRTSDRAWGQIVLTKAESLDVRPVGDVTGLRPIDPQHELMPGVQVPDAARAFEFHEPAWSLTVAARRYELEEVKHTSVERAVVRIEVTQSRLLSVQALYRMRSAQQRLAMMLPADVRFDADALKLNGKVVTLEHGDKGKFSVPLVGRDAEFLVELRYTVPGDQRQLDLPFFPEEPAVQKVYLCTYLPRKLTLLGSRGPWTNEMAWRWYEEGQARAQPQRADDLRGGWVLEPQQNDRQLIAWVTEKLSVPDPTNNFATDGRLYVFSTLRPEQPPTGSLRLVAVDRSLLNGIVFVVVLVLGGLFLPQAIGRKAAAAVGLLAALVIAGVFLPTLSRQIMGAALYNAAAIVLLAWVVWHAVKLGLLLKVRCAQARAAAAARAAAPPPPQPPEPNPPPAPPAPEAPEAPAVVAQEGGQDHA
jgi:hypothetical protein